jgi:hypothetical protein
MALLGHLPRAIVQVLAAWGISLIVLGGIFSYLLFGMLSGNFAYQPAFAILMLGYGGAFVGMLLLLRATTAHPPPTMPRERTWLSGVSFALSFAWLYALLLAGLLASAKLDGQMVAIISVAVWFIINTGSVLTGQIVITRSHSVAINRNAVYLALIGRAIASAWFAFGVWLLIMILHTYSSLL